MADHFGATADRNYGYTPQTGQTRYAEHPPSTTPFTGAPGPGNPATIEQITQRIRNMHPEQISTLADQWQNTWSLLLDVRDFVLNQSIVLRDETWKSPAARDAFLQRGPGETLVYLDEWMDAAQRNIVALRHLADVSAEARNQMELLLQDYRRELAGAQDIGVAENLKAVFTERDGWDDAAQAKREEDVSAVERKFREEAQALAQHYGNQYFDYLGMISNGAGPPVQPLNAVLSQPGAVPGTGGTGGPGPGPGATAPGFPPPLGEVQPGTPPPQGLLPPGLNPPGFLPPGVQPPGGVPPGTLPPGVPPPATAPPGVAPPLPQPGGNGAVPPAVLPPGALPPGALPPGTLPPGTLPPGTLPPGKLPPGGTPVFPPGGVRPGLPPQIPRPGGPNVAIPPGNLPGRTIRRPAAPSAPIVPPGGRQIGRPVFVPPPPGGRPGPTGRPGRTTPGVTLPPPGTQRPGRTTPGITPPIPPGGRPGDRRRTQSPGTIPPGQTGRPGRGIPGVNPPGQGGRPGGGTPGMNPPGQGGRPGGGTPGMNPPGQGGRPGGGTPGVTPPPPGTGRPGDRRGTPPGKPGGTDTFGRPPGSAAPPVLKNPVEDRTIRPGSAAEVRQATAAQRPGGTAPPVLNRPASPTAPPPWKPRRTARGGAAWSDLFGAEEARRRGGSGVIDAPEQARPDSGPWGLRSRAATPGTPAEPNRPGTVSPELGKRRGGGDPVPVRGEHELVTDEQAFGVRTPGGGVVTGRGDEPPEPEVPRAFR
ncbi:hypothetical protein [Actinoplanes utahensis]|uniref:PPE family domain-containing protein n=1 Tax=Actinoplanes utahensis TaxID=1869 RepID=A0A0A6X8Y0_ACTUT|nr:hypothetical protein [Actinoplanes utahensis]KHD76582.1 hypothetical protein MB27_16420 [Actinoplanes utahensis]